MKGDLVKRIDQLQQALSPDNLAREAYEYFRDITPIRSGNAQRNTRLRSNEIHADYAYAQRLDDGWSKQHGGVGMTRPTEKFIRDYINKQAKG